jgi:hypothetical protein
MVFPLNPHRPWDEARAAMRSQKNNIKKAASLGLTCSISHSEEDFEFFYTRMHVPMMRLRHAGYGVVDSKETLRDQFHRGLLMFIEKGGWRLGGVLIYLRGRTAYAVANGVLEGDEAIYDQGVVAAEYLEGMRWAHENGYLRYDLGGVRPFATDGLYSFKYRWGARPEYDVWLSRSWLFWLPGVEPGPGNSLPAGSPAADWLLAHPAAPIPGLLLGPGFPVQEAN